MILEIVFIAQISIGAEIARVGDRYAVQGHLTSLTNRKPVCDFVLVNNLNTILHRARVIADYWSTLRL